eukprot:TRINITY_DN2808_c0_g2_i2.p1 TRINITY_DN2808_c0_g2~~TRINITY_DN2808_c0_g2_i2.p1  ORF type:complete len:253 (+),score=1.34 TRINITY_DN2808_c0_g2_i2:657-1415(+)
MSKQPEEKLVPLHYNASFLSDIERLSFEELRELFWSFSPGEICKYEKPDKAQFKFPKTLNILTIGPAKTGKSSYVNSLMSLMNPKTEIIQCFSELGTDAMTGTIRLEGPFSLNDYREIDSLDSFDRPMYPRPVVNLWTTMGLRNDTDPNLERKVFNIIKNCFLGRIKPGDYTGLEANAKANFNPLIKRLASDKKCPEKYDLAIITVRYGNEEDVALATRLFNLLNKQNSMFSPFFFRLTIRYSHCGTCHALH